MENPGAAPQDRHIWRKQAHPPQSLCWPSAAPAPADAPLYPTPQPGTPTRQGSRDGQACHRKQKVGSVSESPPTGSFPASLHWTNRPSTRVQPLCPLGVWVLPQAATRPVSLLKTESRGRTGDGHKASDSHRKPTSDSHLLHHSQTSNLSQYRPTVATLHGTCPHHRAPQEEPSPPGPDLTYTSEELPSLGVC